MTLQTIESPCYNSDNTAQMHLRPSADIFRRSIGSESLTCTKHARTFQTLPRQKISRRMLSLNRAVLPLIMPYCNTSLRLRQPRERAAPARRQEPPGDQKRK